MLDTGWTKTVPPPLEWVANHLKGRRFAARDVSDELRKQGASGLALGCLSASDAGTRPFARRAPGDSVNVPTLGMDLQGERLRAPTHRTQVRRDHDLPMSKARRVAEIHEGLVRGLLGGEKRPEVDAARDSLSFLEGTHTRHEAVAAMVLGDDWVAEVDDVVSDRVLRPVHAPAASNDRIRYWK